MITKINFYFPDKTLRNKIESQGQIMKIELHMSSIMPMVEFLRDLKNGRADKNQISDIFSHPDYDFEFRRYEIASKAPLIDYFMKINTIDESEIPELHSDRKNMLKYKHKRWLEAYESPGYYEALHDKIKAFITPDTLEDICVKVKKGLPANTDIDDIRIISTMSIGTSFGYVFDKAIHFDIMGFDNGGLNTLPSQIAHEVHHLALWKWVSAFIDSFTLEERYIFNLSGEGLAIKFCNNAKGAVSKAIDDLHPVNEGLDDFSINYLNEHFDETMKVFKDTLIDIRSGKMNKEEMYKQFEDYWWNPYTEDQNFGDEPLLKQSRIYSFGNDLFGTIYDVYGAETLFDCVRHPLKAVEYFKLAIGK